MEISIFWLTFATETKNKQVMSINQFKTFALATMCEAHLWKIGESSIFTLMGVEYRIERTREGWSLETWNKVRDTWNKAKIYPDAGRLFNHLFSDRLISFN